MANTIPTPATLVQLHWVLDDETSGLHSVAGVYIGRPGEFEWVADFATAVLARDYAAYLSRTRAFVIDDHLN